MLVSTKKLLGLLCLASTVALFGCDNAEKKTVEPTQAPAEKAAESGEKAIEEQGKAADMQQPQEAKPEATDAQPGNMTTEAPAAGTAVDGQQGEQKDVPAAEETDGQAPQGAVPGSDSLQSGTDQKAVEEGDMPPAAGAPATNDAAQPSGQVVPDNIGQQPLEDAGKDVKEGLQGTADTIKKEGAGQ